MQLQFSLRRSLFPPTALIGLCALASAQVADPDDLVVVPRYDAGVFLVIAWSDNSPNEDGFELQRRSSGGTFGPLTTVAANAVSFVDTTATAPTLWEYRVRATSAALGDSNWTGASLATSPNQVWPMGDGSRNVLDNYGMPLDSAATPGNFYFHNGIDISGGGVAVVAARGGIVSSVDALAGGQCWVDLDYGAGVTYTDVYSHITVNAALGTGDLLAPGDNVGIVRNDFFNRDAPADHVHWGTGRNNLLPFTQNVNRDPGSALPVVADANDDGKDFIVVPATANDHNNPREPAWGGVDFLVDAYDDMSAGNTLEQGLFALSYWIQAGVPGGQNVRDAISPYRLIQFDYPLVGPSPPGAVENAVIYWPLQADLQGVNTWQSFFTWILTNTSGTDGTTANVSAAEFWKTDARVGTGTKPNGSDASVARENQEARFPDGTYFVHVLPEDLLSKTDHVRSVLVDNSRPYVKRVTVFSGPRIVYQDEWVWDGGAAQMSLSPPTFAQAAAFTALRTQDVIVEVEFSEPMDSASVVAVTPLGVTPSLSSTQPAHARTIWRGTISNLDIADDGTDDGTHMLTLNGVDLAGNALLQIADRAAIGADDHNRDIAGALRGTTGLDSIHGFEIGPIEGVVSILALFAKETATDPASPTSAQKSLELQTALNAYWDEVGYGEISFAVTGQGWFQLDQALDWYYTLPQTPLVDLVQEMLLDAQAAAVDVRAYDYVLVVTEEDVAREEWSTTGGWSYELTGTPSEKLFATGVLNLASSDARVTNLMGRSIGLVDLFAYPNVLYPRPFVGSWSHMSDKDVQTHVLGWEKWRAGWIDETGTATGKTVTRVDKPPTAAPLVDQTYTLSALDAGANGTKLVAIELADGLHYTAEFRRQQNLDAVLPEAGILVVKANDIVPQGEGPAIVQESLVSATLASAPFTLDATRDEFVDVGSGVNLEVLSLGADEAQIRLNYAVPATQNDLFVDPHDDRWKSDDIWVDAPDAFGNFEADPRTVRLANEEPVVGQVNKLYGRVTNVGPADATNFEVRLEILEPWGTGGPWSLIKIDPVSLLQGQDMAPGADYLIVADWTPIGDVHTCVRLEARGVSNDVNPANNKTQENIHEFTTTAGSPYHPVISRFQVHNPFAEELPFLFRVEGLPDGWNYLINPARPVIAPGDAILAQIILQPADGAPACRREEITVNAFAPQVDTLKRVGGVTLGVTLKNAVSVTHASWTDCGCDCPQQQPQKDCAIYTEGCVDPGLSNQLVLVIYTSPNGQVHVRYVYTDANGCFTDIFRPGDVPGRWEVDVHVDETDCSEGADSKPVPVDIPDDREERCPDLIIAGIDRPVWDGQNQVTRITVKVANIGSDPAPASLARLIDPSTLQNTGAPYNDVQSVPALAPGGSAAVTFQLPYWIYNPDASFDVTADYKGSVRECDEENNSERFEDKG